MGTFASDLRQAVRGFLRTPGFTAAAVATLALGIGAAVAIFSVANAVLLRPLPFSDPDRLVVVWNRYPQPGLERVTLAPAELDDLARGSRSVESWAALSYTETNLVGGGDPEHLPALDVSPGFFRLLGVNAAHGRTFANDEARARVAVLSHELWARRFGADPALVGRTVSLDGEPVTVVGVMPRGFELPNPGGFLFPRRPQLWMPLAPDASASRGDKYVRVVARLAPGVTPEHARAEVDALAHGMRTRFPDDYPAGWRMDVVSLHDLVVGETRPALLLLLLVVGFLLLIACANVANLVLARTLGRRRELAVRGALGASRARLVRQLAVENVLLALAGGMAGTLLAFWAVRALVAARADAVPRLAEANVDGAVLGFALVAALGSGVLLGVFPALRTTGGSIFTALRQGGRTATGGGRGMRGVLVVAQIALATMVLVGTGLVLNSLVRLTRGDPGFDPAGVLTAELTLPQAAYPDARAQAALYGEVVERVRAVPGVRAAAVVNPLPLSGNLWGAGFVPEGLATAPGEQTPNAQYASVTPGYFEVMRIRLVQGRPFGAGDRAETPGVVVVDETLAARYWPGESAIGKRLHVAGRPDTAWATVVGVAARVSSAALDAPEQPQIYLPHTQRTRSSAHLVVRATGDPLARVAAVRRAVRDADPTLPVGDVRTMDRVVGDSVAPRRFTALLLSAFGLAALLVASVGLYGVVSCAVGQRERELGLRMALGARGTDVVRMVVREGVVLAAAGVALGAAGALALSRSLRGMLYGVQATDPATFAGVTLLLAGVALLASYGPARRAARVDPAVTLRAE
jgi:predicted permease